MTQTTEEELHTRQLRAVRTLLVLAGVATLVAVAAGLVLLAVSPESTLEGTLGFTAAVSGFFTAILAVAAFVYAQAKNLWQYAPDRVRLAAWALLGAVIIAGLLRSAT